MRNNANKKNISAWQTTYPNVSLSTASPILTGLGLNLGLCGKRLESNHLSNGMDVDLSGISIMDININLVSTDVLPVITLPSFNVKYNVLYILFISVTIFIKIPHQEIQIIVS